MKIDGNNNGVPSIGQFMAAKNKETRKPASEPGNTQPANKNTTGKSSESAALSGKPKKNATYTPQSITIAKATSGNSKPDKPNPVRADKVAEAKYRLEHGGYDNADVLNTIIDRLLGELGK